ncbi:unnamed protein product [Fraxinus pennsylvanica]|uniref:Peptidase C1A papain C-terminal domain-containing protein n=1 Tax=Fraxinus pennsylvanica TaxID=56036 RepID=A0AAD2A943_9LAMI|nr:unnamed protein product [Fraxinus pennsylvanica]
MASLGQNWFLVFLFTFAALSYRATSRLSSNEEKSIKHEQWTAQLKLTYKSNKVKLKRFKANEGTCSTDKPSSLPTMITGHQSVPMNNETSLLMDVANQPVSVRIDPSQMQSYKSGILTGDCGTNLTHAITAVGYGTSEEGTKYWIFMNSWVPNWGENGFIRIQRDITAEEGMCGIAIYPTFPTA